MSTQCLLFIVNETNGRSTRSSRSSSKRLKSSAAVVSSPKGYALFPEVLKKKYPQVLRLFEQNGFYMLSNQIVSSLLLHEDDTLDVIELLLYVSSASLDCLSLIVTDISNREAISLIFRDIRVYVENLNAEVNVSPAVDGKNFEIMKRLVMHKANIHVRHHLDESFLHLAAKRGPESLVNLLLEHGANVQARRSDGATPLHLAAQNGVGPIAQLLLQYGADVQAQMDNWKTPLHVAAQKGLTQMVQLLITNGAVVDCKSIYDDTALSLAIWRGNVDVAEVLLVYGADVNSESISSTFVKTSCCLEAITFRRLDILNVVLKFASKISTENDYKIAKLREVAKRGHSCVFQLLLEGYFVDPELLKKSEIVKVFLDHLGASNRNRFWSDQANFRRSQILARHIVKTLALNLHHGGVDGIDASPLWTETVPTLRDFQTQCETEVACMKSQTLGDTDLFLYDILASDVAKVACFLRNDSVVKIFISNEVEEKYPIYKSILIYNFKRGMERKSLLAKCMKICQSLFCRFGKLPFEIREKILRYLSFKDLLVLKIVCGHLDISL